MKTKLMLLSLLAVASYAQAAPTVRTWNNPECARGSCEIKGIKLYLDKYQKSSMAGTMMAAEIIGSNKGVLGNYAFVQHLKGCIFQEDSEGKRRLAMREYLGRSGVPFKHTEMEIDSASDKDPIYWSKPEFGYDEMRGFYIPRNASYMTKNPMGDGGGSWAGKPSNLTTPSIFVSDVPSFSTFSMNSDMSWVAQNSSLEFKICLHHVKDIPEKTEVGKLEVPNPIVCMNWSSNFVYNPKKFGFEERKEIHPYCLN